MRLRTKLLLAQLPLVIALGVTIVVGSAVTRALARGSEAILKDNYRSVLAAERMKEAAERIDSGVVFAVIGRTARGLAQVDAHAPRFEDKLRAQEGNITEPGERAATVRLREAWRAYQAALADVRRTPEATGLDERYFTELLPAFLAVKDAADVILALNQDAMIGKSDRAQRVAGQWNALLVLISVAGLVVGLLASSVMTTRLLRPLGVLGQTARRLGEGDVAVRARIDSGDEIGALAAELNTMAERIHKYRQSSLGELLEAQLAAQATIDSLPDPVLVIGLGGALRQANRAAERMLHARAEAGDGALGRLPPAIRAAVDQLRQHVAAGHGAYVPKGLDEAIKIATDDGDRLVLPRAAPLYAEEGDAVGVTLIFQDVTRLHRFEELQNDLVATVAHELRTPLTSLRMAVHLLAEQAVGPLTAKQGDMVFAAREDCDRLQAIVDELLDLSRIAADRIELRRAAHDPEQLVQAALEAQRAAAAARGVTLRCEVLPDTPAVDADRERVLLVLANLIGNAIRYGPAGGEVRIGATVDDDRLRVTVHDDGPGVPAAYRLAVFDKYVRVPGAPPGGAGLGLYIAREIVRAHGGEIGIDDRGEPGATFWFTLPLAAAGASAQPS
jgi:two-component system, NtrC family, sensor histidine kinase KinB